MKRMDGSARFLMVAQCALIFGAGAVAAQPEWRLVEDLRIGAGLGATFGAVTSIDVAPDGRIVVLDGQLRRVHIFNAGGREIKQFGKAGSTAGEFADGVQAARVAGPLVYVSDPKNERMHRYDLAGVLRGSFRLPLKDGIPLGWAGLPNGMLLGLIGPVPAGIPGANQDPSTRLVQFELTGAVRDTIFRYRVPQRIELREPRIPILQLFAATVAWSRADYGTVYSGVTDRYEISIHRPGNPPAKFTRSVARAIIPDSIKRVVMRFYTTAADSLRLDAATRERLLRGTFVPDSAPAFNQVVAGPAGIVLVERVTGYRVSARGTELLTLGAWEVLDNTGKLVARLAAPEVLSNVMVRGEHVYGSLRGARGEAFVVRYRLVRAPGSGS
jgi:hypothetical protein